MLRVVMSTLVAIAMGAATVAADPNDGFEFGNFSNWSRATKKTYSPVWSTGSGINAGQFAIVTQGQLDAGISVVREGSFAARLGDGAGGNDMARLEYDYDVPQSAQKLYFNYMPFLQSPGHGDGAMPYFKVEAKKTGALGHFFSQKFIAQPGNEWTSHPDPANGALFRPWACHAIDVSKYQGKTIKMSFTARDCTKGGHGGYAYVDAVTTEPPQRSTIDIALAVPEVVCDGEPAIADGSATRDEQSVFWSVEESDAGGGRPNPASEVMKWFTDSAAGQLDLRAFMRENGGGELKCNTYYRVKLAASNSCTSWDEEVRLMYHSCAPRPDMPPICLSPDSPLVKLGTAKDSEVVWWFADPPQPGSIGTGGMNWDAASDPVVIAQIQQERPIVLGWHVTNQHGCTAQGSETLFTAPPHSRLDCENCCKLDWTLSDEGPGISSVLWSNGATGMSTHFDTAGTQTVQVVNACGSESHSMEASALCGREVTLIYPNTFTPTTTGGGLNDDFIIYEFGPDVDVAAAYAGASGYRLTVFDRWGAPHVVSQRTNLPGQPIAGLPDGIIRWNGRIDGVLVPQGVYNFKVELLDSGNTARIKQWHKVAPGGTEANPNITGPHIADSVLVLPTTISSAVCGTLPYAGPLNGQAICERSLGISSAACVAQGGSTTLRPGYCLKDKVLSDVHYYESRPIRQTCPSYFHYVNVSHDGKPLCQAEISSKIKRKNCDGSKFIVGDWCAVSDNGGWYRARRLK